MNVLSGIYWTIVYLQRLWVYSLSAREKTNK
jgi:hypothetical protein